MKDAIGGGLLFNLVIIFVVAIVVLFISSLAYSKAYKVKNRIIEIIEKYGYYDSNSESDVAKEIQQDLALIGYPTTITRECPAGNLNGSSYRYCVYKKETKDAKEKDYSYYYEVVTYVYFDFPIIEDILQLEVKGETKLLGNKFEY